MGWRCVMCFAWRAAALTVVREARPTQGRNDLLEPIVIGRPVSHSITPLVKLAAVLFAVWLALAVPAGLWGGAPVLQAMAWAVLLCLLPTVLDVAVSRRVLAPPQDVSRWLVSTGVRLAVVLAGTLWLCVERPELLSAGFALWLIPFYLTALAVEVSRALRVGGLPVRASGVT